ncbi:WD repeat-containing protein 18 [Trichonephila inaurata madagascariensis]|uniref:WD repeat-containing protein 18 n=1 Tax=Trichonephila inaurata madagascariensis TaxID=2747483 RepID=A0A8X6MGU8_9ARAC|nr:WD repeat-containing protein 18 [Trichonephila inaurata madagascariensis]
MDSIPEVIITSSSICAAHDSKNGNLLASYSKCREISPKTLCLIGEDYLIGAVQKRPISTGELLNVIERHYQDVTCLKFTGDDSRVLSGGKDGHVIVWILAQMIDVNKRNEPVKPLAVWNHHSAEVTDIYIGPLSSRAATVSVDMSCKVYELDSLMLLSSICMDTSLTAVIMDPMEYYIFLGDRDGCLYQIVTYEVLPREIHSNEVPVQLKIHQGKIISFSFFIEGSRLLTACEDGTCKLWDIPCMSCVMTITLEGSLTNAFLAMRPIGLKELVLPQFHVRPFMKEIISDRSVRKCIESKIHSKTLTFIHENEPAEIFSENILNTPVTTPITTIESASEGIFQEALYPESIEELRSVNNQLYSYLLKCGLEKITDGPSSAT